MEHRPAHRGHLGPGAMICSHNPVAPAIDFPTFSICRTGDAILDFVLRVATGDVRM